MVTRNFLNILAMALQAESVAGALPLRGVSGSLAYARGGGTSANQCSECFPGYFTAEMTTSAENAGISIGSGGTAARETDYNLEATITSGVSLSRAKKSSGVDENGCPYVQFDITVTNTGSEPITVREIGYKQPYGKVTKYPNGSETNGNDAPRVFLLDRSVLAEPLTIAAGDAGIINYRLCTIPQAEKTVAGIKMASFTHGSDEEIAAMLDAASAGLIDLQRDAGWRIGELRKISLGAFTSGGTTNAAEELYIAISSFDEYMGCGNVMQFDFACCASASFFMNSSGSTTGGYGASEMCTTTLPAMADALPAWLKTRLKTFSVLSSCQNTVETVSGNRLALRSYSEIGGYTTNEGSQIEYYRPGKYPRAKSTGLSGSNAVWWTRTLSNPGYYIWDGSYFSGRAANTSSYRIAPFGCV